MAFEVLGKRKRQRKKKSKAQTLRISIPSHTPQARVLPKDITPASGRDCLPEEDGDPEQQLAFYESTHEEEDGDYVEFLKQRLKVELARLHQDKNEDMKKINAYILAKWEERSDTLQKHLHKVRLDMATKQTKQRAQLAEKHKKQHEADQHRIEQSDKWLVQKQQRELQQQMNAPASGMIDWNTLATHMQSRHTLQRQQFEEKKAELRKRSDRELKAQDAILEAHHKKRQVEAEACIKDFTDKICHTHQKMKAMLMTMHKE